MTTIITAIGGPDDSGPDRPIPKRRRPRRDTTVVPRRFTPIPDSPLILSTEEVAVDVLRSKLTRRDRRSAQVRAAVNDGVLPPPLNPQRRIDCWRFSVAQIERWLARGRHPSGRAS